MNNIRNLIVESNELFTSKIPAERNLAPCTVYHFDKFQVEVCHNGRPTHPVKARGVEIGRITRDELDEAIQARVAAVKASMGLV